MNRRVFDLKDLKEKQKDWEIIPVEAIPENYQKDYQNRKLAIDLYISGVQLKEIEIKTGVKKTVIYRLLSKCILCDADGKMYGYHALIPYKQIIKDFRDELSTGRGMFNKLLGKYPELKEFIIGNYYGLAKYTLEKNMNFKGIHKTFLTN